MTVYLADFLEMKWLGQKKTALSNHPAEGVLASPSPHSPYRGVRQRRGLALETPVFTSGCLVGN